MCWPNVASQCISKCSVFQVGFEMMDRELLWHGFAVGITPLFLVPVKVTGFPYSLPSVGSGADPGVQAVSPQVTISHPPGGRLPLRSARSAVTFPATEHHRPLAGTQLYYLVTEAHRCEQTCPRFCPE